MRALSASLLIGLSLALAGRYHVPDATTPLHFPRDQASHDDARLEWWYVTGHLEEAGGKRFGFELTFFRSGVLDAPREKGASPFTARDLVLAHLAFTDGAAGSFRYEERIHRPMAGAARVSEEHLDASIEDWRLEEVGSTLVLRAGEELSLVLVPLKPLVLHGENGLSKKGGAPDAVSRYVSYTRLS
ncbi:MAG TPA: carotenoid 1,2-hydratase, partial [Thermoanaerobaculia bacterium]|nr:carotenoid 1,2-hydratase [Thermoanaerobaculia bacterium]